MLQSIFYKEWTKTKRAVLLLVAVFAAMIVYAFINNAQALRLEGAVAVWSSIITKDISLLPSSITWLPLLAGLLVGFAQYTPEMANKRLKLTLHLPIPENKILSAMLIYGVGILFAMFLLVYLVLIIGMSLYYPSEVVCAMIWSSLPWFLGGLIGYLFVAWICIEPVWKQRIFNSLIAIAFLSFFYMSGKSGAYATFVPYLVVLMVLAFSFPFFSTARFKDGAQ